MRTSFTTWRALILCALLAAAGAHAQPAPAAYIGAEEGSGTTAHDGVGHHDVVFSSGGATGWEAGLVGAWAISFPGFPVGYPPGSWAEIPSGDVLDTTRSYSVAAWVKLKDVSGYQTFVSQDGDFQSAFFLQLRGDTGQFSFTIPYGFFIYAQSGFTPVTDRWYHLAGVYDASAQTASLYVDGALVNTVYNVPPRASSGLTGIGRGWYNNDRVDYTHAALDDIRFYAAALSASDVYKVAAIGNPALVAPQVLPASITIDAAHPGAKVDAAFAGLMIEEINHALDGGLYGELIQNRVFRDDATTPVHWSLVQDPGIGALALDTSQPIADTALTTSLKVTVVQGRRVGVANDGYWGIPVRPQTYTASFWAKAGAGFDGPLTVSLESSDGKTTYAAAQVPRLTTQWAKYTVPVSVRGVAPNAGITGRFVVAAARPGVFWLNQVSLFPPTYQDQPNGNRPDLMDKLAALRPGFLRMPGGNYLEGATIATRFDWKSTIGAIEQRPGHPGPWGYRSDDGLGLFEYLKWCEALGMQPLLAVYAGYSLDGSVVAPGAALAPYVQDALDEIQFITGPATSTWGARRAAMGHPAPFPLRYVEIGNEDFFDASGSYDGRFAQFHDAIKAAYPALKLIATARVASPTRPRDLIDDHFYNTPQYMARDSGRYDAAVYDRATQPKVFIGEWASISGAPTPDLAAALGDAAWLAGLERNSDVVLLEAYAPLLANVNPCAYQWPTNLIGYDATRSVGSPSYWLQVMFNALHGDVVLPATVAAPGTGSMLYQSTTRDTRDGAVYIKLVNMAAQAQAVHVDIVGGPVVANFGTATVLKGRPQDTNTLGNPTKVVPVMSGLNGLGRSFDVTLPASSVTVLALGGSGDRR
jgi:alpha-L-arabinofuranosidase